MKKVLLSWSSGKDCAWSLHLLRQQPDVEVVALVTTLNQAANRVAMHAVRRELLEAQAERLDLPLWAVDLPWPCSNADYGRLMRGVCERAVAEGIAAVAFGDLFLEDVRAYRVKQMEGSGLELLFPAWGIPTNALAREMIAGGVRAKITCVDPRKLDAEFAGRDFNLEFLESLPAGIDPCGENGEFHSFVYDAPVFSRQIAVSGGEVVTRDGFVFADVVADNGQV
jgi:uncharacterized protein (TIGR00290 family)